VSRKHVGCCVPRVGNYKTDLSTIQWSAMTEYSKLVFNKINSRINVRWVPHDTVKIRKQRRYSAKALRHAVKRVCGFNYEYFSLFRVGSSAAERTYSATASSVTPCTNAVWAETVWLVQQLITGWTIRESNPSGARFSAPVHTGPGAHPASYTIDTRSFPRGESCLVVVLTTHPV
jgi:hypothetical protein